VAKDYVMCVVHIMN